MGILLTRATVLTGKQNDKVLTNGAVAIDNDKIIDVGDSDILESKYQNFDKHVLTNRLIIPGLINNHTHTVLNVLRGAIENAGAADRVYGYMVPISFVMTDEDRKALAAVGCLEAIKSGTTTLVDPLRFVNSYAETMANTGLRLYLAESAADAVTTEIRTSGYRYDKSWGDAFLERTLQLIDNHHATKNNRVQCMVAAHATDICSPWLLRELNDIAHSKGLRRTIHLAQSSQEVTQVKSMAEGKTPVEYLLENDWLGRDVLAAHCSYCTTSDIGLLSETATSMAHCPASSARRGYHGLANMPGLVDLGVNVTLGTDNMSEDMFEAMRVGLILNRGMREDTGVPTPKDIFNWATINPAYSLEREDLGNIDKNMKADISIVRLDRAHLSPIIDTLSSLVHYGQASDVESVIVDGEWVMKEGKVLTMDEEEVITQAQNATIRAWSALKKQWGDIIIPEEFDQFLS